MTTTTEEKVILLLAGAAGGIIIGWWLRSQTTQILNVDRDESGRITSVTEG